MRIGCGAGFSADRLEPALDLAEKAALDFLVFECVGERTLAFGHRDRMRDPSKGYNSLLERRMKAVLPVARRNKVRIMTNMGAANPRAAAEATIAVARELGLEDQGYRLVANHGPNGGQLVFHFHVHLFGGRPMSHRMGNMPRPGDRT
jgi:hypothetical protein